MPAIADEYLETHVMTASSEKLHLMVVDGALRFSHQAVGALESRNFATAHESLNRARSCIDELVMAVQTDHNPELAERVKALFVYVHRNLVLADLEHDPQRVRDAIRILTMHRETWVELMDRLRQERTSSSASQFEHEGAGMSWTT